MPMMEAAKERQAKTLSKEKRAQVSKPRVSTTDAEARVIKMPDGGFRPASNLEMATEVDREVIVGVGVETKGSDGGEAPNGGPFGPVPMVQQVNERTGHSPEGYLMDGGFATRGDITTLERQGIVVYAPARVPRTETSGRTQANARPGDTPEVASWRRRMETGAAKETYKERAATAECVNARARAYGLRQLTA